MAALQKIRNRGVIIGIIIGGALFAFIAGDALKSGGSLLTNSRNEMAEIAGESVNIRDFQKLFNQNIETAKMMSGRSSLASTQVEQIRQQTWQDLVQKIVMDKEYEELGIAVSADELYDMVQGPNMDPTIKRLFQKPDGTVDKAQMVARLKQLIEAPDGTPQKQYWLFVEQAITKQRKAQKFDALLKKGLYVPAKMVKFVADKDAKKVNFNYIVKNYSTIPDKDITVSESEIKTYYEEHKELFKQKESRRIDYVPFLIEPSTEDYKAAEKWLADLKPDYTKDPNAVQFVELNSDTDFNPFYFKKDEITNKELADFAFKNKEGAVYGPYLENEAYKLAKINNIKMMADSVKARHILIRPVKGDFKATKAKADSIERLIKRGKRFDDLARKFSDDKGSAVNGGDLGWFTQGRMVKPFNDAAFNSKRKDIKVVTTQFGVHILQVTKLSKPVKKVQLAIVDKKVAPSNQTTQMAYAKARKFAGNNLTRDAFFKAISEQKLQRRTANLKKNTQNIPGLDNSRSLVRAAYQTDEMEEVLRNNDNSAVFEFGDKFVVAILSKIDEEGYAPIANVTSQIKRELIKNKKAEKLIAELQKSSTGAKSLLSIAQKQNLEVKNANDISFSSFQIPGAGIEPVVIAEAADIAKGKISAPLKGNQGVYMILVTNVNDTKPTAEFLKSFKPRMETTYQYRTNYQAYEALKKAADIEDYRYKFY